MKSYSIHCMRYEFEQKKNVTKANQFANQFVLSLVKVLRFTILVNFIQIDFDGLKPMILMSVIDVPEHRKN